MNNLKAAALLRERLMDDARLRGVAEALEFACATLERPALSTEHLMEMHERLNSMLAESPKLELVPRRPRILPAEETLVEMVTRTQDSCEGLE